MKIRIAMFSHTTYKYDELCTWDREEDSKDWVRISEWVEVDLPERSPQVVLDKHLHNLALHETELRADMMEKLQKVEKRRKELLALPAPVSGDLLQEEIAGREAMDAADQAAETQFDDDSFDGRDRVSDDDLPF